MDDTDFLLACPKPRLSELLRSLLRMTRDQFNLRVHYGEIHKTKATDRKRLWIYIRLVFIHVIN